MRCAAILVAGGSGTRFGGERPKQYLPLGHSSVLQQTVSRFATNKNINDIIVVIAKDAEELYIQSTLEPRPRYTFGGETRAASVQAGLEALSAQAPDLVLIHDAARPHISHQQIDAVIAELAQHEGCAPALPIVDAIKQVHTSGRINADADRNAYLRMQTPQGFQYGKILYAIRKHPQPASAHDDISIALYSGLDCVVIPGDPANIKITTQSDMTQNHIVRTGSGFDVHRICEGELLHLCGVPIKAGFSLLGHSDADVGLHALTDAILGAIAQGDIGDHFPPSDPQWKGVSSDRFLGHAKDLVEEMNGSICNVDVTLVCERPKIKPHREAMRTRIAEILALPLSRVSVKATTTEGLGFAGRGEGIAAQAVVSVEMPS